MPEFKNPCFFLHEKQSFFNFFYNFSAFFNFFSQNPFFFYVFPPFSPLSIHRCCCLQFGLFLFSPVLRTCEILYASNCGLRQQQLRVLKYRTKCACNQKEYLFFLNFFYSFPNKHLQILPHSNPTNFRIKCASSSNYREASFLKLPINWRFFL